MHSLLLWFLEPPWSAESAQTQRISNHAHRGERHGRARDHWAEQNAKERVEQTCSDRDANRIVDESKKQVLPDVAHHGPAQPNRLLDSTQVAAEQCDACALHRDVSARAHGNADVSGGERGRVVDSASGHCDHTTLLAQSANVFVLVLRINTGFDLIDAELLGHRSRGTFIIAGQHDHSEAKSMQMFN